MGVNGWMPCYALPEQAAQQSYNFIEDYEISFMIVFIVLVTLLILYIVYENHTRNKELLKYAQTDELKGNNISISIGISTAPQDGGLLHGISINAPWIRHFTRQNEVEKQECATISHENSLLPILLQFQIEGTKRSSSESPSDR